MIRINIALRPPRDIEDRAIRLASEWTKNREVLSALDGITSLPHITFYAPVVDEKNLSAILSLLEQDTVTIAPLLLTYKEIGGGQGFGGVEFNTTPYAKQVLDKIVSHIVSFRETALPETYDMGADYHMEFSPGGIQSLERYGSVGIVNFHPHLTLLRLKDELEAGIIRKKIEWGIHQFACDKLAVFAMGEYGTCMELIEEFPLIGKE